MKSGEQKFLNDLDKKLWNAADRLRSSLDAAVYKHAVLGLIFLKYVSDSFDERREELRRQFQEPDHEYYLDPDDFDSEEMRIEEIESELEVRDYYTEKNVFWVPHQARWQTLQNLAALPPGAELPWINGNGNPARMKTLGRLIDDALEVIEKDNPKLKGILNRNYASLQLEQDKLLALINEVIGTIPFKHESLHSKDILGHVYEYFLGQFALAEGKKGGQFFTPKSIVTLIVEMLQPYQGRVYDPAMGSGGFFVQSERFIKERGGKLGNLSVYGQESNPTTWRLAAMNMVIRGIDFNFGRAPADSFTSDQHPDLRADTVMANPPFNMNEWWNEKLADDPRWDIAGTPPQGNSNFAWLQHMLYHLAPNGSLGLLLANGSMSSNTNNEGTIRKNLIEKDLVECMVALPGQLFTNTQIPACIWFLTRNKKSHAGKRDRSQKFLFIDARQLGYMKDRVLRDFKPKDIKDIADSFHAWQKGEDYEDKPGFCASVNLEDIRKHDHVLTPGRYVGAAEEEDDGEPFPEKMQRLTGQLKEQLTQSAELEKAIRKNLGGLGYDL